MKVRTICDAQVLMPNMAEKNFTHSAEIIPNGTILEGEKKLIDGLRKGQPFTYRLFVARDGTTVFLNTIEPMPNTTEVIMNADGPTHKKIMFNKPVISWVGAAVAGAAAGYMLTRTNKSATKKQVVIFVLISAVTCAGIGMIATKGIDTLFPEKKQV